MPLSTQTRLVFGKKRALFGYSCLGISIITQLIDENSKIEVNDDYLSFKLIPNGQRDKTEKPVRVHRYACRVRKFTAAFKDQLLEHIAMGHTLSSFLWRIRNSPFAISKAAIYKQLSRDPEFKRQYQLAREFGADMICGQVIHLVDRGVRKPSLAIMKNWWPKNTSRASKRRAALIRAIRLLNLYATHSTSRSGSREGA